MTSTTAWRYWSPSAPRPMSPRPNFRLAGDPLRDQVAGYQGSHERAVCETVPIEYLIGEPQKNDVSDTGSWLFSFEGGI